VSMARLLERIVAEEIFRWTAVVRGAAMHGIEKSRLKNYVQTASSPNYYGLAQDQEQSKGLGDERHQYYDPITGKTMGKEQMSWIIHRGDLILLSSPDAPDTLLSFILRDTDEKTFTIPIYQYLEDDDDLPVRLKGATKGKYLEQITLSR
jgi:hypothetical protein